VIAFPAGTARMKVSKFLAYSTVGIVIWDIILIYIGVLAGQNATSIVHVLDSTLPLIGYAVVGGIIVAVLLLSRRRRRREDNPDADGPSA
jgi:membrane protein DedA with SNARE-associated domain